MTISVFARASRLSPKALRLYDELGLLLPAHVDPVSGYRFYAPAQLERARLVAWLRHLGMPLVRIRSVLALEPAAAAEQVAGYWAQVETDLAARRDLAVFLVDQLRGSGDHLQPEIRRPSAAHGGRHAIRYAARSHIGRRRPGNQDAMYAGRRLLAVADGFGPDGGGERASAAALGALASLDVDLGTADLLNVLQDAMADADRAVRGVVQAEPQQVGSTLTAVLWAGSQLALVHIGDSRAHLLRDGELFQLTHDHTVVQSLIDEGRISLAEAVSHPQPAVLLRALFSGDWPDEPEAGESGRSESGPDETGPGESRPGADLQLRDTEVGDRYLLCSDGLSAVVGIDPIHAALSTITDLDQLADRLIELANDEGGPDNITCIVADVVRG